MNLILFQNKYGTLPRWILIFVWRKTIICYFNLMSLNITWLIAIIQGDKYMFAIQTQTLEKFVLFLLIYNSFWRCIIRGVSQKKSLWEWNDRSSSFSILPASFFMEPNSIHAFLLFPKENMFVLINSSRLDK